MSNNGLTKSFTAEGLIGAFRIIKAGAAPYGILQGAAATDKILGITTEVSADAVGERTDVILTGIADLKLGGTVAGGDPITSDATGQGVVAAPAAGVNNRIIGFAVIAGVVGDIIPVTIEPGFIQG
jgi:hypothetical protein